MCAPTQALPDLLAVMITVKKLLVLFLLGFLVGSTFAEEQPDPKSETPANGDRKAQPESRDEQRGLGNNNNNNNNIINIKVPDTTGSASTGVSELLAYRGAWVQSGAVVVILNDGEKEIYVKSPANGVIMKINIERGDSVSRGATLVQLKKVNTQRPNFLRAWKFFGLMNVSVSSVGKRIGGRVKDNINIPEKEQGKWENACAIRMSFVLNNTGFPIKQGKYSTVSGQVGGLYIYRLDEITSYLRDIFGEPDIVVNRVPKPEDFSWMQGILVVTGDGRDDARGHVTLWNGSACSDTCHLEGDENNVNFKPVKAALWVLP